MKTSKRWLKAVSYLLMFSFIILIIPLNLFPCFIAGFLVYEAIISLTPLVENLASGIRARLLVATMIIILVMLVTILCVMGLIHFLTSDIKFGIDVISKIDRIFSDVKSHIPDHLPFFFPESAEELKDQLFLLIESNLIIIRKMGRSLLHGIITVFIGFVIGTVISLNQPSGHGTYFTNQLLERLYYLSQAFRNIIYAQIKVSLVNTLLTSIMILLLLPLFGIHLPLSNTLVIATFICGLLPIIGNLISNFMIIISALSISLGLGGIMIIYLVSIHKLEYFLNAKIVGNCINAKSWELLLAMLIFEEIFGLRGLVVAPIYYAYLKTELRARNII
ncbi:AI-2E family transporter [Sodalis sp. CWE]|uniref:AI-2E family transporter n=1 Tax=Sodalis sp. CWE TaxID=2803816 RepID=UPI001C7CA406|nr:AI-2E family transporter [Sodalis sp. CWE]MBX4180996.1 AI-2E family transporter [Sodalis sp. CWE]